LLLRRAPCALTVCKGVRMWYGIAPSGLASTGVDFTESLALLIAGLVSLVWLSAGLIAFLAVQHYWFQTQTRVPEATLDALGHREAA
jgi:hypothetical protein